jgi:uncharacterized protein YjiS (DUF1127 family)
MRDYVLFEARRRHRTVLARLFQAFANLRTRNDLRRLQAMDAFALRDIGLTHADIDRLLRLPASVDMAWETDRTRRPAIIPPSRNK